MKEQEIQRQVKTLIHDSIRIERTQLGELQYNAGYLQEAQAQWNKALEICQSTEDGLRLRQLLAKSALVEGKNYLTEKFARDALDSARPDHDPIVTSCLRAIHALHWAAEGNHSLATAEFLTLALPQEPELE